MAVDDLAARRDAREAGRRADAADRLADGLAEHGSVVQHVSACTPEQWRDTTAAAEQLLRRPVAGGVSHATDTLWALLLDWPCTADELLRASRRHSELSARTRRVEL